MSFDAIFNISKLAMQYEMMRTQVASSNIARANIPLEKGQLTAQKTDAVDFDSLLQTIAMNEQSEVNFPSINISSYGVKRVYEPDHLMADQSGYVSYPDIDVAKEFIVMTLSKRAYEANVRVFNNAGKMFNKTLEIGRT